MPKPAPSALFWRSSIFQKDNAESYCRYGKEYLYFTGETTPAEEKCCHYFPADSLPWMLSGQDKLFGRFQAHRSRRAGFHYWRSLYLSKLSSGCRSYLSDQNQKKLPRRYLFPQFWVRFCLYFRDTGTRGRLPDLSKKITFISRTFNPCKVISLLSKTF